jgi:aspartate aminotransferase-like enzyme
MSRAGIMAAMNLELFAKVPSEAMTRCRRSSGIDGNALSLESGEMARRQGLAGGQDSLEGKIARLATRGLL